MIRGVARGFVGAWRLLRGVVHLLHGMAIVALRFPSADAATRARYVGWWSTKILRLAGIGLEVLGTPRPGAALLVSNHVSWLDIPVITDSALPVRSRASASRSWYGKRSVKASGSRVARSGLISRKVPSSTSRSSRCRAGMVKC